VRAVVLLAVATVAAAGVGIVRDSADASATVPSCSSAGIGLSTLGGPNFYVDSGNSPTFLNGYTGYTVTNNTGSAMSDTWVQLSSFTGDSIS
jgi:hypothetical protein